MPLYSHGEQMLYAAVPNLFFAPIISLLILLPFHLKGIKRISYIIIISIVYWVVTTPILIKVIYKVLDIQT